MSRTTDANLASAEQTARAYEEEAHDLIRKAQEGRERRDRGESDYTDPSPKALREEAAVLAQLAVAHRTRQVGERLRQVVDKGR